MKRPDTLELTHHAQLSLNYLTRMLDSKLEWAPYFMPDLEANPREVSHTRTDFADQPGGRTEALLLMRKMTGSKEGQDAEAGLKKLLMSYYHDDGLHYHPVMPWCPAVVGVIHDQAYILDGLTAYYEEGHDPQVKKTADSLIDGLLKLVAYSAISNVYEPHPEATRNYYFPCDMVTPDGYDFNVRTGRGKEAIFNSCLISPLMKYFEATGYERALDLAAGLVNDIVHTTREIGYDGRFIGHFHAVMWVVSGILHYSLVADRPDLTEIAMTTYEWAKRQGSSFGWFPEWVGTKHPRDEKCETCCITDMIYIAYLLGRHGRDDYWQDVERFTRNHLVESQLKSLPEQESKPVPPDTLRTSYQDVGARAIGGFAGYSTPNDFLVAGRRHIAGCCGGTGARALFHAWDGTVEKRDDVVRVNMSLSRKSPWLDLFSHHPYEGKLELHIHDAPKLRVRVPSWAGERVSIYVDGVARLPEWEGHYLKLDGLVKGQEVVVVHPMPRVMRTESVNGREFTVDWWGETAMQVSPEGRNAPFYQRLQVHREVVKKAEEPKMV